MFLISKCFSSCCPLGFSCRFQQCSNFYHRTSHSTPRIFISCKTVSCSSTFTILLRFSEFLLLSRTKKHVCENLNTPLFQVTSPVALVHISRNAFLRPPTPSLFYLFPSIRVFECRTFFFLTSCPLPPNKVRPTLFVPNNDVGRGPSHRSGVCSVPFSIDCLSPRIPFPPGCVVIKPTDMSLRRRFKLHFSGEEVTWTDFRLLFNLQPPHIRFTRVVEPPEYIRDTGPILGVELEEK